jgi:hypothetical protein
MSATVPVAPTVLAPLTVSVGDSVSVDDSPRLKRRDRWQVIFIDLPGARIRHVATSVTGRHGARVRQVVFSVTIESAPHVIAHVAGVSDWVGLGAGAVICVVRATV